MKLPLSLYHLQLVKYIELVHMLFYALLVLHSSLNLRLSVHKSTIQAITQIVLSKTISSQDIRKNIDMNTKELVLKILQAT